MFAHPGHWLSPPLSPPVHSNPQFCKPCWQTHPLRPLGQLLRIYGSQWKTVGIFPFDEPTQRRVLLALINELHNLSHALSLPVLPCQSYELAEWWEAQLRQWAWNPYTRNPRQQVEAVCEVRNSPGSNLWITFSASARAETNQPDSAGRMDLLVQTQPEGPTTTRPSNSSTPTIGKWEGEERGHDHAGSGGYPGEQWGDGRVGEKDRRTSGPRDPRWSGRWQRGKQPHNSQTDTSRPSSAVPTPKKAKLPESVGARPNNTTRYSFSWQDIRIRMLLNRRAPLLTRRTWPTKQTLGMDKVVCGLLLGLHEWHPPYRPTSYKVFARSTIRNFR